jgi:DNA-binding MarR family transcriptional regulator
MEERGLVIRAREGDDRRYVTTRITKAGLDLLEELNDRLVALHKEQLGHLGPEKLRRLIALLGDVRRKCR